MSLERKISLEGAGAGVLGAAAAGFFIGGPIGAAITGAATGATQILYNVLSDYGSGSHKTYH